MVINFVYVWYGDVWNPDTLMCVEDDDYVQSQVKPQNLDKGISKNTDDNDDDDDGFDKV